MEGRPEELFELLEQLGKGSFGSVYKARHRPSGTIVAVKVIPLTGEDEDGLEDTNDEDANDDSNEGAIDEDNEFFDPDDEM